EFFDSCIDHKDPAIFIQNLIGLFKKSSRFKMFQRKIHVNQRILNDQRIEKSNTVAALVGIQKILRLKFKMRQRVDIKLGVAETRMKIAIKAKGIEFDAC